MLSGQRSATKLLRRALGLGTKSCPRGLEQASASPCVGRNARVVARLTAAVLVAALMGCAGRDETVFTGRSIQFEQAASLSSEAAGLHRIWVRLSEPAAPGTTIEYKAAAADGSLVISAFGAMPDETCSRPDLELRGAIAEASPLAEPSLEEAARLFPRRAQVFSGTLEIAEGETRAAIELWTWDDDLAELDERLILTLTDSNAGQLTGNLVHELTVSDSDRTTVVAVTELGADARGQLDSTGPIQDALDQVREGERVVVHFPPGDYLVKELELRPGTTLVGYGARLFRPPASGETTQTLSLKYSGPIDSPRTVISGLTLDGERESQGEFRLRNVLDDAHLLQVGADPKMAGRVNLTVQDVTIEDAPGSGIRLDAGVNATLCDITARDVWQDAIHVDGGGGQATVTGLWATGQVGTTGLYLSSDGPFLDSRRLEFKMMNSVLGTGDIEIEVAERSEVQLTNVVMLDSHFRLNAEESTVNVDSSVIRFGLVDGKHNAFHSPGNVRFSDSDLYISEEFGERDTVEEVREFAMIEVDFNPRKDPSLNEARQELTFVNCRFHAETSIEPEDRLYLIRTHPNGALQPIDYPNPELQVLQEPFVYSDLGRVTIIGGIVDRRFNDVFAPGCRNCSSVP